MPRRAVRRCFQLGLFGFWMIGLGLVDPRDGFGAEPTPAQGEFFEKKIRPLLETNCFACHSHKSGKSKGHLVVDSLGALLKGGDSGPALAPGRPDETLLLKAVGY